MGISTIQYRELTLDDRSKLQQLLNEGAEPIYATAWQDLLYCRFRYAFFDGCLISEPVYGNAEVWCAYPLGTPENRCRVAKALYQHYNHKGLGLVFYDVFGRELEEIKANFGALVTVEETIQHHCYILSVPEQLDMQGSKFADRRRRLRRFNDSVQWTYEELTAQKLDAVHEINAQWFSAHDSADENLQDEQSMMEYVFAHFDELGMQGAAMYVDGKAVAYCLGHPAQGSMYCMLYQKSLVEYRDAMLVLLQEFFKRTCSGYEYINESCDLGIEGLRLFKSQLRPCMMLECNAAHIASTRKHTLKSMLRVLYHKLRGILKHNTED